MSNNFLNVVLPTALKRMAARVNISCALAKNCYREYSQDYSSFGAQVQTKLPMYFKAVNFTGTAHREDVKQVTQTITMNQLPNVGVAITTEQMTLNVENFQEEIGNPLADAIRTYIEVEGMKTIYKQIYNTAGTPGTPPNSYAQFLAASAFLDKMGASKMNRAAIIETLAMNAMVGNQSSGLLNIFNEKNAEKLLSGYLFDLNQTPFYLSEGIPLHTAGNVTTAQTIQVNANVAEDATSIALKGFTASTGSLKAGDVFTIAGIYGMNYAKRESTGLLQRFVVLEDATANSSGVLTVNVSPRVTSTASTGNYSQYPNVSSLPLENAAVTILTAGTANGQISNQNIVFQKNAISLVTRQLAKPEGGVWSYTTEMTKDTPIQIRGTFYYDVDTKTQKFDVDCLFGFQVVSPWFCARLQG